MTKRQEKGRFGRLDFSKGGAVSPDPVREEWADTTAESCTLAGDDLFVRGKWEPALAAYSRALRFDRGYAGAWAGQVRCLIELREFTEAVTWATRGMERFGNTPDLLAARGLATALGGDWTQGISFLDGAVQSRSPSAWVWLYRARALVKTDAGNGMRCLLKAQELAGSDAVLTQQIGKAYLEYRLFDDSVPLLKNSDRVVPGNAYTLFQLARAYEAAGDARLAKSYYERAIAVDPLLYSARDGVERLRKWNPVHAMKRLFQRKAS